MHDIEPLITPPARTGTSPILARVHRGRAGERHGGTGGVHPEEPPGRGVADLIGGVPRADVEPVTAFGQAGERCAGRIAGTPRGAASPNGTRRHWYPAPDTVLRVSERRAGGGRRRSGVRAERDVGAGRGQRERPRRGRADRPVRLSETPATSNR